MSSSYQSAPWCQTKIAVSARGQYIYARVSTEEQAEEGHSIDAQIRIAREFCAHKGWTVVGEYIDAGRSGRTLKRPKMQALIADTQLHLFVLGDLSECEYLAERKRIQNELAASRPTKSKIPDLERAALMLENFGELWERATDLERMRLLHAIIEKAWVKGGRIIAIEPRPAMHTLLEMCAKDVTTDDGCEAIKVIAPGAGAPLTIGERQNTVCSGQSD